MEGHSTDLAAKASALAADGEWQHVIEVLEPIPVAELSLPEAVTLAQAYVATIAATSMDYTPVLEYVLHILSGVTADGANDLEWNYLMGTVQLELGRAEECLPYLSFVAEKDPDFRDVSLRYAAAQQQVADNMDNALLEPLSAPRLARLLEDMGFDYSLTSDSVIVRTEDGIVVMAVTGPDKSLLAMTAVWLTNPDFSHRSTILELCNQWNATKTWPQTYVTRDQDGTLTVHAKMVVSARFSITRGQLWDAIHIMIQSTEDFFDALALEFSV
ncbi:MAG: YbjN domain-containing protein [Corynebacterium sp.]|nr:YbjN domain-containing protein [Corynebacterium sp.]